MNSDFGKCPQYVSPPHNSDSAKGEADKLTSRILCFMCTGMTAEDKTAAKDWISRRVAEHDTLLLAARRPSAEPAKDALELGEKLWDDGPDRMDQTGEQYGKEWIVWAAAELERFAQARLARAPSPSGMERNSVWTEEISDGV